MHTENVVPENWQFAEFTLDRANQALLFFGKRVVLRPKVFTVLECLTARAGLLVSKDQLMECAWRDAEVQEAVLKSCLAEIRRLLKDSPDDPRFIETVHRRGYRFIAPVTAVRREAFAVAG